MNADDLFRHAMTSLPEAVGDMLRDGRSSDEVVFASFDGASELGMAVITSELAQDIGVDGDAAHREVVRMLVSAKQRNEELVISVMVTKEVLMRILNASDVDGPTRVAMRLWLDGPLAMGNYRVVSICGNDVRAATVDGISDEPVDAEEEASPTSTMLN